MPGAGVADRRAEDASESQRESAPLLDTSHLLASVQSYRAAMMSAQSPYMIFTLTGETVLVNAMFTQVTGFTLDDLPDIRACLQKMRHLSGEDLETSLAAWPTKNGVASIKERTVYTASNELRIWQIRTTDPVIWPDGRSVIIQSMFDLATPS